MIPIAKRGINILANDLNPGSIKWLKVNVEKNLKQKATDFKSKVSLGKSGKTKFGQVEVSNHDGHDIIRSRLIELVKTSNQKIEILMNLPGGALFFLPTFRGISAPF